ncbi:MAG: FAD-binding oxidoreductase [Betaproteobacteria bacterium]
MIGDCRSHGLWETSAPPPPGTQPLADRLSVDVAIVGAGYTGLSAALHLEEAGVKTVVLEACELGFGGSGRNVGLVNAGMWVAPSVVRNELGGEYGHRLLSLLGNAPSVVFDLVERHEIDCEAVHAGTLHCAVGQRGLAEVAERARQWLELGAPVELLDAKRTQQLIGTRAYSASLFDRRAGTIQPLSYARGLAAAAIRAGARIHTQTKVLAAERVGSEWQLSASSGGLVSAKWIIVATNAYTGTNGLWPAIQRELVQLPYFNLATEPLSSELACTILPERQGAWDTQRVLSSFRFDASGRLVFGSVGALRGFAHKIHHDWGRRALRKLFPQLGDVPFEHEWYGMIGMTSNALPRFHELDRNVISFSGFNGRGIAPGTVFGREMAKLVAGQIQKSDLALPVTAATDARWRTVKEVGYQVGAQLFHAIDART